MYLKLPRVKVHVSFLFCAALTLALQTEAAGKLAVVFAAAFLHEAAHLVCLLAFGCRDLTLTLLPGGARIGGVCFAMLPYGRALASVLAGPGINLLLAGAFFLLGRSFSAAWLRQAFEVNLTLGLCNLLPLSFLDGGRALWAALDAKSAAPVSARAAGAADLVVLAAMTLVTAIYTLQGKDAAFLLLFTAYCIVTRFIC